MTIEEQLLSHSMVLDTNPPPSLSLIPENSIKDHIIYSLRNPTWSSCSNRTLHLVTCQSQDISAIKYITIAKPSSSCTQSMESIAPHATHKVILTSRGVVGHEPICMVHLDKCPPGSIHPFIVIYCHWYVRHMANVFLRDEEQGEAPILGTFLHRVRTSGPCW